MFSSTANGTSGSHWNIMSSVVCDTETINGRVTRGPVRVTAATHGSPFAVCIPACRAGIS